jgi:hypothetical protein
MPATTTPAQYKALCAVIDWVKDDGTQDTDTYASQALEALGLSLGSLQHDEDLAVAMEALGYVLENDTDYLSPDAVEHFNSAWQRLNGHTPDA